MGQGWAAEVGVVMARGALNFHKDLNINKEENQTVLGDLRTFYKFYLIKHFTPWAVDILLAIQVRL